MTLEDENLLLKERINQLWHENEMLRTVIIMGSIMGNNTTNTQEIGFSKEQQEKIKQEILDGTY
jgi:hypothetical protein